MLRATVPVKATGASSRDDLSTGFVPHRYGIDGTCVAGAQEAIALDRVGIDEHHDRVLVQVAVDHPPQPVYDAFDEPAHIPSRPSSVRAVSIRAGVIS